MKNKIRFICFVLQLILIFLVNTSVLAKDTDSQWFLSRDFFKGTNDAQIACVNDTVHAIWRRQNEIYWSYARNSDIWSKPVIIAKNSGGRLEVISDDQRLHMAYYASSNLSYKCFDGQSWSEKIEVFKKPTSNGTFHIVIVEGKPHLFWMKWIHGKYPHAPMHSIMMHTTLTRDGVQHKKVAEFS